MSLRLLTLLNVGMLVVAFMFSYRDPTAGIAIRALVVLVDLVAFCQMLIQGEFSNFCLTGDNEIDRHTDLLIYIAGLLWVLLLAMLCGGFSLLLFFRLV